LTHCNECGDLIPVRCYCHTCYVQLEAENARLREALVLIDCNDVNPSTSDISPLKRQQVMGRIARVALKKEN